MKISSFLLIASCSGSSPAAQHRQLPGILRGPCNTGCKLQSSVTISRDPTAKGSAWDRAQTSISMCVRMGVCFPEGSTWDQSPTTCATLRCCRACLNHRQGTTNGKPSIHFTTHHLTATGHHLSGRGGEVSDQLIQTESTAPPKRWALQWIIWLAQAKATHVGQVTA